MKKNIILEKIIKKAKETQKHRKDPRYKTTMGFLVAKGLLYTNEKITALPNARLNVRDAIWAGEKVEPRILEVLPAAICRFEKHFQLIEDKELINVLAAFKKHKNEGPDFREIPYKKLLPWIYLELNDKRTKTFHEKRIPKNFRLKPESIKKLKVLAATRKMTETELLETLIAKSN